MVDVPVFLVGLSVAIHVVAAVLLALLFGLVLRQRNIIEGQDARLRCPDCGQLMDSVCPECERP